jgi:hypothetical protein
MTRAFIASIFLAPKLQQVCYRCAIVLYLSILIFGSIPGARSGLGEYASGGVLHFLAYSILLLLSFAASNGNRSERAVKSILAVMAMGAFDEYVQSFFPYRGADVRDWAVDVMAGVLTAATLWMLWPILVEPERERS